MTGDLSLTARAGLPPALQVLVAELPRLHWPQHPNFHGLASFWLDRHLDFRRVTGLLQDEARARLDGGLDPRAHAARVSRLGGHLIQSLHGHHQIEDHEYFPVMARMDPRVTAGFDLLEADHQALDGLLAAFVTAANAVISGGDGAEAAFETEVSRLRGLLIRHLEDEEDLVVPLILRTGM